MKNKLISYYFLGATLAVTPVVLCAKLHVRQPYPVYTQPVYVAPVVYQDPSATLVGAAIGAACGISLLALLGGDHYTFDHTCWLYFSNDVLVQWGRPNDWPKEADSIQEIRYR